jgi:hypothetical protein
MLRITTTPPETKKLTSASDTELETAHGINEPAVPPAAVIAGHTHASAPGTAANAGSIGKPGFLKGFSFGARNSTSNDTGAAANANANEPRVSGSSPAQTQAQQETQAEQPSNLPSGDPLGATPAAPANGQQS